MKIERVVTVFDNKTERLIKEINVDYIDVEQLKKIFNVPGDDPMMYKVYEITPGHVQTVNELLRNTIVFDLGKNAYYFECSQL